MIVCRIRLVSCFVHGKKDGIKPNFGIWKELFVEMKRGARRGGIGFWNSGIIVFAERSIFFSN